MSHDTQFFRTKGAWFFRILGYGLWWATYDRCPAYFSERNGYRKILLKAKTWRVAVLTPGR